jgi:hypothetical protein
MQMNTDILWRKTEKCRPDTRVWIKVEGVFYPLLEVVVNETGVVLEAGKEGAIPA